MFDYARDMTVFNNFEAPGNGRYKLGKSLFHFWENKKCEDIGSVEFCACS